MGSCVDMQENIFILYGWGSPYIADAVVTASTLSRNLLLYVNFVFTLPHKVRCCVVQVISTIFNGAFDVYCSA